MDIGVSKFRKTFLAAALELNAARWFETARCAAHKL
jgi:hypothetical protein